MRGGRGGFRGRMEGQKVKLCMINVYLYSESVCVQLVACGSIVDLRHYATSRKVMGSIPGKVIEFFS
jgi:hypothetical protein